MFDRIPVLLAWALVVAGCLIIAAALATITIIILIGATQ